MTTNGYPRVLIVAANPISRVQSAGIMMGSLFRGWPKDRLAQIYFPLLHSFPPDATVCSQFLRVNALGLAGGERPSDAPPDHAGDSGMRRAAHRLARNQRFRPLLVDPLRETLTLFPWLDRRLEAYGRSFRPDVIYTLMGTLGVTRSAARLAAKLDCPIVPHFTDHWIDTRFVGSPFGRLLRRRLQLWLDRVLERSPELLAVTGTMAEEYAARFDRECHFFTTLVSQEPYRSNDRQPRREGAPLRLVYAGSLGLQRAPVLRRIGSALQAVAAAGLEATLEVYCSGADRRLYRKVVELPGIVRMHGWVPAAELPGLLSAADVLVHVESDDPAIVRYTRHAFSTKLSEYMMAQRSILLVGPPDAGSMREMRRLGDGLAAESTVGDLERTLRELLSNSPLREALASKARAVAMKIFESDTRREEFRVILKHAADKGV